MTWRVKNIKIIAIYIGFLLFLSCILSNISTFKFVNLPKACNLPIINKLLLFIFIGVIIILLTRYFTIQYIYLESLKNRISVNESDDNPLPLRSNAAENMMRKNEFLAGEAALNKSLYDALRISCYGVSHDMKSPLRAIKAYSKLLAEQNLSEDEKIMNLNNIQELCTEMLTTIDHLLIFSELSQYPINKETVDLNKAFLSNYNNIAVSCPERDIEFVISKTLPKVNADRVLMNRLIDNILTNAIKFTREKAQASIIVNCIENREEWIISVTDNGIGFDMSYAGDLFVMFQKLNPPEQYEGIGIGLAAVKNIILKHGGKAWIEGNAGVGAVLYFSLPKE